jgi:hypothetical protein
MKRNKKGTCRATIGGKVIEAEYTRLKEIARASDEEWIHGENENGEEFVFHNAPCDDPCRATINGVVVEAEYTKLKEYAYAVSDESWIYGEDSDGAFGFCNDPNCTCDKFVRYG